MLKSLYSGVSGMKSLQTKMDVISNNIANVNTTGFKASRVQFQDLMSQTTANAQAPGFNGAGGVNARQVGLGVKVGAVNTMMGNGTPQPTGRSLDFALDADGFFVLKMNDDSESMLYTRDGALVVDSQGYLTNAEGFKVMGLGTATTPVEYNATFSPDTDLTKPAAGLNSLKIEPELTVNGATLKLVNYNIDATGLVTGKYDNDKTYVLGQISLATFANPDGLEKQGGNNYQQSNNSGEANLVTAGKDGAGRLVQGALEGSNVDLANEFTDMIVASRAYQANSRSITTSDEMLQELINLKR